MSSASHPDLLRTMIALSVGHVNCHHAVFIAATSLPRTAAWRAGRRTRCSAAERRAAGGQCPRLTIFSAAATVRATQLLAQHSSPDHGGDRRVQRALLLGGGFLLGAAVIGPRVTQARGGEPVDNQDERVLVASSSSAVSLPADDRYGV